GSRILPSPLSPFTSIYRPEQGKLWFSALEKGLFEVDLATTKVKPLFEVELKNITVFDIINVGKEYVLATSKGIYQIKNSILTPKFNTENIPVSSLLMLDDFIIAGTYGKGLFCYNYISEEEEKEWSSLFPQDLSVQDLLLDSKSRIWIATYGKGVYLKKPGKNNIHHFSAEKENPYALHYNDILKIFEDNTGVVW
ncbi:hybrid sensor histidine kinase/response regulator, partial [Marivirga lumbricoides]